MHSNKISKIFFILDRYFKKNIFNDDDLTELKYLNHFTLLISILLSAQTTDKNVNKATKELFKIIKTPYDILQLGESKLNEYISTINYHNIKAKNITNLSKILIDKFNSQIPYDRDSLMSLPGIGRKTANLFLSIVDKKDYIAVDTHVFRVSNRIGLVNANNVIDTENQLYNIVPKKYIRYTNTFLVLLGRYTCKAKKPNCNDCIINHLCKKNIN